MKLLAIIIFTIISRFLFIDKIPPSFSSSLWQRYLNASLAVVGIPIIYLLVRKYLKSKRIALISSLFFAILPWTVEQGRIVSPVNISLVLLMGVILFAKFIKHRVLKLFVYLLIPPILYFFYPQFWLFRIKEFSLSLSGFLNNLFIFASPDFFFFKNPTFWWGGVREFGIVYLILLPFLLFGIYELLRNKRYSIFVWMLLILFISAASPFFPESREFYFITPLLSIVLAVGVEKLYLKAIKKNIFWKTIFISVFMLLIYEFSQFFHYYMVHYPQQVRSNIENIHEAF